MNSLKRGFKVTFATVVITVGIIGCASTNKKATTGSIEDLSLQAQATESGAMSQSTAAPKGAIRGVFPEWFLNPPKEEKVLFASSSAVSADMQLSLEKAVLNAQHALASQLSNAVSGKMKSFALERGVSDLDSISSETEKVIREQVSEVNLGGYIREKTEIVESPDGYRAFVLLSYRLDDKMRRFRGKSNTASKPVIDDRAKKAFSDLEESVTVTPVQ